MSSEDEGAKAPAGAEPEAPAIGAEPAVRCARCECLLSVAESSHESSLGFLGSLCSDCVMALLLLKLEKELPDLRLRCEGSCYYCSNPATQQVHPMTHYGDEPPFYDMCDECAKGYIEHWTEMWAEYHSSVGL